MGLCGSKKQMSPEEAKAYDNEKKMSKQIEKQMNKLLDEENKFHKLLLLGAGESGKSTLFKQMVNIYANGYSEEQRKSFVSIIHNNVLSSMKELCIQSVRLSEHNFVTTVQPENEEARLRIMDIKPDTKFTLDGQVHADIVALWKDSGIQKTYELRSRFQLTDSAAYFFDRINDLVVPNWIPDEQDILRARVRTTGIIEKMFQIEDNWFKIFDVGGQRNERKKWIHCFDGVTAILFVAAISEYDMVLFEDENTNRMVEALNLFEEICNMSFFKKTSIILFFNKKDLFQEKIVKVPLNVCFPEYPGMNNYEEASDYIRQLFMDRNRNKDKTIYYHFTTATDKNNMKVVFLSVKDIVVRNSLKEGGLMV